LNELKSDSGFNRFGSVNVKMLMGLCDSQYVRHEGVIDKMQLLQIKEKPGVRGLHYRTNAQRCGGYESRNELMFINQVHDILPFTIMSRFLTAYADL
jgi:hypothetical protein